MRIKLASITVCLLSTYLLGLNIISLQLSFEYHAGKEIPISHLNDTLSVVSADSSNLPCELCAFFQNQVFCFSQEKAINLTSFPDLLPVEKRAAVALIELFNQSLRGVLLLCPGRTRHFTTLYTPEEKKPNIAGFFSGSPVYNLIIPVC